MTFGQTIPDQTEVTSSDKFQTIVQTKVRSKLLLSKARDYYPIRNEYF